MTTAARGDLPAAREAPSTPIGTGGYDVVVGDLLYSQLLYPALRDTALPRERVGVVLARIDRPLVASVVRRLHASVAPGGVVVHVHDPLGWWDEHVQPVTLDEILAAAATDVDAALALVARGHGPSACDPRAIALEAGIEPVETAFWRWPFQQGVDYLACATVTRPGGASACTSLSGMDALEQYLSERYWSEDDLLREVRADIAERGPLIQVSAEAGRLLALLVRAAGATRVLEVGTLFGYSGIWMARELPPGRAAGHDRDREAARRRRRALVRARRPGRSRHRAPRRRRGRARDAARPLRRRLHRRRQGDAIRSTCGSRSSGCARAAS